MPRRRVAVEQTPARKLAFARKRLVWAEEALERYAQEMDELNEKIAQQERLRLDIRDEITELEASLP